MPELVSSFRLSKAVAEGPRRTRWDRHSFVATSHSSRYRKVPHWRIQLDDWR